MFNCGKSHMQFISINTTFIFKHTYSVSMESKTSNENERSRFTKEDSFGKIVKWSNIN